jgi:UDPglucose 6-dehydrogenase
MINGQSIAMNITIIGTGYVGLVSGACFAELGNEVTCLDINSNIISQLKKSKVPFFEPDLEELVQKNIQAKTLKFTTSYAKGCKNNLFFVCVDTPDDGMGSPDLTSLHSVLRMLKNTIKKDSVLVLKSTLPIGTNKKIADSMDKHFSSKNIKVDVCSNPEFLKEGSALKDFMYPDRIILGTPSESSKRLLTKLYKPLMLNSNKLIHMSVESAELTKYASNAFLATKISFMNEIALIAEKSGANIHEIREGMGADKRIGSDFLFAGLGFGGSCFPKDMKALISFEKKHRIQNSIINSALKINQNQVRLFFKKLVNYFGSNLKQKSFVLWGLSFKPNTDDIRNSVALELIKLLSPKAQHLYLFDPKVSTDSLSQLNHYQNITFLSSQYENFNLANGLIICTEWDDFKFPEIKELDKLQDRVIFDGRNILDPKAIKDHNLTYVGIG